ncbi:MAG: response regulator, partial [Gammaproteobacteria bacterium]|nr:response regulator [Gammaproteobacteria bacterium]
LTRWRLVLVAVMTASSTAWAFASAVAAGPGDTSAVLLIIAWTALSLSLVPSLSWIPGLIMQLTVALLFVLVFPYFPGHDFESILLPLGMWASLALLALIAASYLRRVDQIKGEMHYMRLEASELQKRLDDADETLANAYDQRATLEAELSEILHLAEDASRAKTEFLATMSHEIRTPLNGILPILEMLLDSRLNPEQVRMVRTAQGSSRHLLRIINDILDFAKVESGKLQLETIEIDVRELVGAVTELMSGSARNHNLKLSASVADNVPEVVRGDPIRLRQVLINLVSNAIKFTEEGGIRIEVSRGQTSQKEIELLFAVADTGVGMSPETADRLFQSFTQADASTTRKHGGTGLGLVICKRLVELMGGKIGVRSALGQGSTFWFLVPLRKSVTEVPSARRDLDGVRILVLIGDGEESVRVGSMLQGWGVIVDASQEPSEALAKLRSTSMLGASWTYELLLIDATGFEQRLPALLAEIRSIEALDRLNIVAAVRTESMAHKVKREFRVLVMADGFRPEPLRRLLYRLFDVESRHFANIDLRADEVYDDLNVSVADVPFEDVDEKGVQPAFVGQVLLVEDNPVNLGVVRKALSKLGLHCATATDGRDALSLFRREAFHMIFMDCQMPVMDGYEATRAIRELESEQGLPSTPIIAMTANAMAGDREKCLQSGMDDYLAKPVALIQLQDCVAKWIDVRGVLTTDHHAGTARESNRMELADVLDQKVLQELREIMEDDYVGLLRTYLRNAPRLLGDIRAAIAHDDVEAIVIPVHSLKSSSANVGAMHLSGLARDMEKQARAGDISAAKRAFAGVETAFVDAESALQELVANGSVV